MNALELLVGLANAPIVSGAANIAQFKNLSNTDVLLRLDRQDDEYLRKIYEQNEQIITLLKEIRHAHQP